VRSINLDQWKEREVQSMENGGNKKVNLIFEAKLGPYSGTEKPKTGASGSERERFIRDKYERRKFYDSSVMQGYNEDASDEESGSEDGNPQKPSRSTKSTPARTPSDAARRRAEMRNARLGTNDASFDAAQSSTVSSKVKTFKRQVKSVPVVAPAPVDLLDFDAPVSQPSCDTGPELLSGPGTPQLDLFADMNISNGNAQVATAQMPAPAVTGNVPEDQRKMKTNEILAMFNSVPTQQQPTQGFGDFSAFNSMNSGGGSNPSVNTTNKAGSMPMMNSPSNSMMGGTPGASMGFPLQGNGFPLQGNMIAHQQTQHMMMMQQSAIGNASMFMQQRTDSGTLNTMIMQPGNLMGGNGMAQNGGPVKQQQQGFPIGSNGMGMVGMGGGGGLGVSVGMGPPMNTMNTQVPMGGVSPATAAVNQLMGGQPMGGQPMGGQSIGGQAFFGNPMGGQGNGNSNQEKPNTDKFAEFSPW